MFNKKSAFNIAFSATIAFLFIVSGVFLTKLPGFQAVIGWVDVIFGVMYGVLALMTVMVDAIINTTAKNKAKNSATIEITPHSAEVNEEKSHKNTPENSNNQ